MKYDKEYSTQYLLEVDYLKVNEIYPTFNKFIDGVKTFKYEKNNKLFKVLEKFYK